MVTVVIVNWERPSDTEECIESLLRAGLDEKHIILVDNGSRDDSVQIIRNHFPDLTIIQLPNNLGFSAGYNAGIKKALERPTPFIFLLNNDVTIEKTTIRELICSTWDISVPKICLYKNPNIIWSAGARWRAFPPSIVMIGYGKRDGPTFSKEYPLEFATGCALMVKREVLESINGFDPDFTNYMEDYDFCLRVREAGFRIGYVPTAQVLHKVSQTLGEKSPIRWCQQGRNTVLFFRKHKRFSSCTLILHLFWVTIRELIKQRIYILPHFWQGVCQGWAIYKTGPSQ